MRDFIFLLSNHVISEVSSKFDVLKSKRNTGLSPGGDTQFDIDDIAESAVYDFLIKSDKKIAYYSEDKGLRKLCEEPEYLLIIDPIDGTRGAAAGLECSCFSIAVSSYKEDACINDIKYALLYEFKTKSTFYADHTGGFEISNAKSQLSQTMSPSKMFWSMEFNGHPAQIMTYSLGELIDKSANPGGVFIFNSASYSISRIITGQLDCYVDIGNRLVRDVPELEKEFRKVGNGQLLHLFPYDIAAAVYIAKKAGVVITDAYGDDLGKTKLLDISKDNLQSCIAASNKELHTAVMKSIRWINSINEIEGVLY